MASSSEDNVVLMAELGIGVLAAVVGIVWERRRRPDTGGVRGRTPAQDQLDKLYLIIQLLAVTGTALQQSWLPSLFAAYGYGVGEIRTFDQVALYAAVLTGVLLGSYADTVGRRLAMQAWALLSLAAAVLATDSSMSSLVVARLLSGIAMGLLGSAFEAWFVHQQPAAAAASDPPTQAFAACVAWSGLALVLAQLVGYYAAQLFGPVGPVYVSGLVVCTALFVISACCSENYGDRAAAGCRPLPAALTVVARDRRLRALAVSQALGDWAVSVLALCWPRTLDLAAPARASVRTYFLVCTSIGAMGFAQIVDRRHAALESLMPWVTTGAALALVVGAYMQQISARVPALFLFQVAVGLYWPGHAALRAKYVPEERRAAVIGLLAVPGAIGQIVALQYDNWFQGEAVLWFGAALLALSSLCQQMVLSPPADPKSDMIIAVDDDEMATA